MSFFIDCRVDNEIAVQISFHFILVPDAYLIYRNCSCRTIHLPLLAMSCRSSCRRQRPCVLDAPCWFWRRCDVLISRRCASGGRFTVWTSCWKTEKQNVVEKCQGISIVRRAYWMYMASEERRRHLSSCHRSFLAPAISTVSMCGCKQLSYEDQ